VPAMIGAMLMLTHPDWMKPGVYNCEDLNPDPFMEKLNIHGLPWNEEINGVLPHEY
ncbi:MAG: saccharopine dehydrogenase family protein, partial [Leadbetterella sp.]